MEEPQRTLQEPNALEPMHDAPPAPASTPLFDFELRFYRERRPDHDEAERTIEELNAVCRDPQTQTLKDRDGYQALFREPAGLGAPEWGTVAVE